MSGTAVGVVVLVLAFAAAPALAGRSPSPETIEKTGAPPMTLTVVEPHKSEPNRPVEVACGAFPAPVVLAAALGPEWATSRGS